MNTKITTSNPTQELNQKVLHSYGWSATFGTTVPDGFWFVDITLGWKDTRRFVSTHRTAPKIPLDIIISSATVDTAADATQDSAAPAAAAAAAAPTISPADRKKGVAAASQAALEGLAHQGVLAQQASKRVTSLENVFFHHHQQQQSIPIYESNEENWRYFWQHKPTMVGIDTEGNQSTPPVLLQISTMDYTIMETPWGNGGGGGNDAPHYRSRSSKNGTNDPHQKQDPTSPSYDISHHVKRLLKDDTIIKVFCDNFSHHDKTCLGLVVEKGRGCYDDGIVNNDHNTNTLRDGGNAAKSSRRSIVDIEVMAGRIFGPVKVARGLSRIVTFCLPPPADGVGVLIRKPKNKLKNVGRFSWIEQGKAPPLKSIYSLSAKERQYAALDAWCTLWAYQRLCEIDDTVGKTL